MNDKWKKVAKENIESLKDINPDKANKDQYLLYAASVALLDHEEPQGQYIQLESENVLYDDYMSRKRTYRGTKADADKENMIVSLGKYMDGLSSELEEMIRDADCNEERKIIKKCINKILSA